MARVVIADRQPLFREAVCSILTAMPAPCGAPIACEEAATIDELLAFAQGAQGIAAIVVDISILGVPGLSQLVTLRSRLPSVPLAVMAAEFDQQRVKLCVTCGVAACIAKTLPRADIAAALQTVLRGGSYLPNLPTLPSSHVLFHPFGRRAVMEDQDAGSFSGRQAAVLDLVTAGKSNKQIAWELSISETTVKAHMTAILRKLGVNSRAQAIVLLQHQPMRAASPH